MEQHVLCLDYNRVTRPPKSAFADEGGPWHFCKQAHASVPKAANQEHQKAVLQYLTSPGYEGNVHNVAAKQHSAFPAV